MTAVCLAVLCSLRLATQSEDEEMYEITSMARQLTRASAPPVDQACF